MDFIKKLSSKVMGKPREDAVGQENSLDPQCPPRVETTQGVEANPEESREFVIGQCRRFPPSNGSFPRVDYDSTCGEWAA